MTSITKMIRMDHTHVLATFHKFEASTPARVKKGLADTVCLALEVHAKLEEEIFYPALREVSDSEVLRKSEPEHYEMKQLIARLREMKAGDPMLDSTFYALMRQVTHHVADEETVLLPEAERLLAPELTRLGTLMSRRRLELMTPRTPELAGSMARSMSGSTMLVAAGLALVGGMLLAKRRPVMDTLTQAQRTLQRKRLLATARNFLPGRKPLMTRLLAR
jgi:hypothetical protein